MTEVFAQFDESLATCEKCRQALDTVVRGDEESIRIEMYCPLGCDYGITMEAENQAEFLREMEPPEGVES